MHGYIREYVPDKNDDIRSSLCVSGLCIHRHMRSLAFHSAALRALCSDLRIPVNWALKLFLAFAMFGYTISFNYKQKWDLFAMKTMDEIIYDKIQAALSPTLLEVINESRLHQGHAGDDGSGESHYKLRVASCEFAGKSRLECHRMINAVLADELESQVHALSIVILE